MQGATRHPLVLLLAVAVLTAWLGGYAVDNLRINTDTSDMLDADLPHVQVSNAFKEAFPQLDDLIVIVVESESLASATDGARAVYSALRAEEDRLQELYQPGAGPYWDTHGLLYLDVDELWELDDRLADAAPFLGTVAGDPSLRGLLTALGRGLEETLSAEERQLFRDILDRLAAAAEAQARGEPARIGWRDDLFRDMARSQGTQRHFIMVKPRFDYSRIEPAKEALALVRDVAARVEASAPAVQVRITGGVAMDDEELVGVTRDTRLSTSLAFLLVCIVLVTGVRSGSVIAAIVLNLVVGLVWTAAFAAWAVGALNLISVSFAVLFIGMGVDFGIQLGMRYREELARAPDQREAMLAAAEGLAGTLPLAAVAAAIAFFSFWPTSYRGLAELGIIAGTSMFIALATTLTVLPALLIALPRARALAAGGVRRPLIPAVVYVRHRRLAIGFAVLTVAGAATLAHRVEFDFNPLNLKDATTDSVAAFRDLLADPDTTPYTIQVLAESVEAAEAKVAKLEALEVVEKTVSLAAYVPGDQDEKLEIIDGMRLALQPMLEFVVPLPPPGAGERLEAFDRFTAGLSAAGAVAADPAYTAAAARLAAALDALRRSDDWPDGTLARLEANLIGDLPVVIANLRDLLQAGPVAVEDLPADLRHQYVADDGRARVEVYPRENLADNSALRRFVRAVQAVEPEATDSPVSLLEGGETVIRACIEATALALVLTALLLALWLRSLGATLLVMLPITLALTLMGATSVLFDVPFNLANIIALPLLIGLNNAYGAYLVLRRQAEGSVDALMASSTPRAILFSGLTTAASFGTLAVSNHPGMASMGIFIGLAILYALVFALVVLPAVMAEIDARRASPRSP